MDKQGLAGKKKNKDRGRKDTNRYPLFWFILVLGALYIFSFWKTEVGPQLPPPSYSEFYRDLKNNPQEHKIRSATLEENVLMIEYANGNKFRITLPENDPDMIRLLRENLDRFEVALPQSRWFQLLYSLLPALMIILILWYFSYRGNQLGNRIWSFGKARARAMIEGRDEKVTFKDVAGVDEAKEELQEVIEFLKDPKRFQRLGGKMPKGVLLVGPPGCGKTLIAKAVAGEAGVPFFSISGSDFVEMFVGVGASRVRDLFDQGRRAAKSSGKGCIIFIDEIDAVGRLRFSGIGGGHDEREQTLNQLLVEMDGFGTQEGLILIAATNRPDTLDPALLRPGRFDRHIVINLPDIAGREEILKVHTRYIKLASNVDLKSIAQQTSLFSGADLANLCNEAALLAARKNKEAVDLVDLEASIERVIMGPEKKSRVMSKHEKEITAYHEGGHALLSLLVPGVDPLRKVSIIPRGMAGGYTLTPPTEDRHYWTRRELIAKLCVALGGRVSEEINLGESTTGAENDLENVTAIARSMVCEYGMSSKLGNLTLGHRHGPLFLGRDIVEERNYSEETARLIDSEVKQIVDESYAMAKDILLKNKDKLVLLAQRLLEKEVLDVKEVKELVGLSEGFSSLSSS